MRKYFWKILMWIVGIAILGGIGYFIFAIYALNSFVSSLGPCGFDDGPFVGVLVDGRVISDSKETYHLSNDGKLILENRADTLSPIFSLVEEGNVKWSIDMDVRNTKEWESTRIWEISKVSITEEAGVIKMIFLEHWTFGAERGSMEIERASGNNSFCLSW